MVVSVTVLLLMLGSGSLPVTSAVLVIGPAVVGVTRMVATVLEALATLPRLQVTTPPNSLQLLWGVADTKFTVAGKVSVSITPVASDGPLLETLSEYVRVCPTTTGSGKAVLEMDRSATRLWLKSNAATSVVATLSPSPS